MPLNRFINIAKVKIRGEIANALIWTLATRLAVSIGTFLLVVTLGRIYGTEGVGVFALAQSLVLGVSIIGRWGMNGALLRFVGRDLTSPKIYGFLRYAIITASLLSLFGALFVGFLRKEFAQVFDSMELVRVLVGIAIAIPAFVMSYILSGFMAAVRRPAIACLLQNGAISFFTALILVVLAYVVPRFGMGNIGTAYACAAWLICMYGMWKSWSWLKKNLKTRENVTKDDVEEFRRSSSAFLASDIATFMISVVGVWIAGIWLSTSVVGLFKAADQYAMLIGVLLSVINLVLPTRFSSLHYRGNRLGLQALARRGALASLILASIPLVICFFAPALLLRAAGEEFVSAAYLLQILAVGQLINLGCGSVGHVLNMTGHERLSRNIAWVANIIGLSFLMLGTPLLGVTAVAVGVALALVIRKFLGVYFVWARLGIWVPPIPNILKRIGVTPIRVGQLEKPGCSSRPL